MFFIMMLLTKVHSIQIRGRKMIKIKDGEVRPRGCMCELCSDISPIWRDMRSRFGYTTLGDMLLEE